MDSPPTKKSKHNSSTISTESATTNGIKSGSKHSSTLNESALDTTVSEKLKKKEKGNPLNGTNAGDEEDAERYVCPIASPMAPHKLEQKITKIVHKANKGRLLRKGVREVQKSIRKGNRGIVIFAADTSPVDIIMHLPILCEEANIPYCFVASKRELGRYCSSKRSMCTVLVVEPPTVPTAQLDASALAKYTKIYRKTHGATATLSGRQDAPGTS